MLTEESVREELKSVIDPELNVNIVDLGLVYEIHVLENNDIRIVMTLTTPGCPLHDSITGGVKHVLGVMDGVNDVDVEVVWEPAWSPEKMSPEGLAQLHGM